MKKLIYAIIAISFMLISSCNSIDYNYKEYYDGVQKYAPCVNNLTVTTDLEVIHLSWENPKGSLAKKIKIDAGDDYVIVTDELISEYTFTDMPIKGYTISVYTIDKFGNLSVPKTINAFPGSNNEL